MSAITLRGGPCSGLTIESPGGQFIIVPELLDSRISSVGSTPYLWNPSFVRHKYDARTGRYRGIQIDWIRSCPFDVTLFPRLERCFKRWMR